MSPFGFTACYSEVFDCWCRVGNCFIKAMLDFQARTKWWHYHLDYFKRTEYVTFSLFSCGFIGHFWFCFPPPYYPHSPSHTYMRACMHKHTHTHLRGRNRELRWRPLDLEAGKYLNLESQFGPCPTFVL